MPPAAPQSLDDALAALAALARREPRVADPYVVGGAVRDALLARTVREADIVVGGAIEQFVALAAQALGARAVPLGARFGVWRLPVAGTYIDLVPMRGNLSADLAQRDLTVNAMAVPLGALPPAGLSALRRGAVIDPQRGLDDLDARVLRLVGERTIEADPLRALRVVRLACELAFDVLPETLEQVSRGRTLLAGVAAERVGAELLRLLDTARAARGLRLMDRCGLLAVLFEPLEAGRDVEQRPQHRYTVLEHALVAAEWTDVLLAPRAPDAVLPATIWRALWEGADWSGSTWAPVDAHLQRHAAALRAATLLHDIGKPATRTTEPDGRTRFFGHADVGAELAASALRRWRIPHAFIERVALLVRHHLRPGQVATAGAPPTPRALYRLQRSLGDATPDACWLFLADSLATVGGAALAARWPAYVAHVRQIVTWRPPPSAECLRRVVDGHTLMSAVGIEPGAQLGRLLAAIEEAAAAGEVETAEQAVAFARQLLAAAESEAAGETR